MSGKLTPPERLPALDPPVAWLLPLADLFMVLMVSRPPGGSLRTARISLGTLWLSAAVAILVGLPGVVLSAYALRSAQWLLLGAGLVGAGLGLGSASLIAVGIRQRQLLARQGRR